MRMEPSWMGLVLLYKEEEIWGLSLSALCYVRRPQEDGLLQTRKLSLTRPQIWGLELGLPASRAVRRKCWCVSPLACGTRYHSLSWLRHLPATTRMYIAPLWVVGEFAGRFSVLTQHWAKLWTSTPPFGPDNNSLWEVLLSWLQMRRLRYNDSESICPKGHSWWIRIKSQVHLTPKSAGLSVHANNRYHHLCRAGHSNSCDVNPPPSTWRCFSMQNKMPLV